MKLVAEESLESSEVEEILPLDRGLAFALANKRTIFLLALVSVSVELLGQYLIYSHTLAQNQIFLIAVVIEGASAWLYTCLGLLALKQMLGEEMTVRALALSALRSMPKVLMSYLLILAVLVYVAFVSYLSAFSGSILPLLIMTPAVLSVVLLIWAPLFCLGEQFAVDAQKSRGNGVDLEDLENGFLLGDVEPQPESFFLRKSSWHLGFMRSVALSAKTLDPHSR